MGRGRLTTHVLDTARGMPAANLSIDALRLDGDERVLLKRMLTNSDGRTQEPILAGDAFTPGIYELLFRAGEYLRAAGLEGGSPPFLSDIPVRFGIADADQNFHVPLLLSPFGYSTYRGS